MKVTRKTLSLPRRQGIRLVALQLLRDVTEASEALSRARSPEALHDFRVALRRLRSWLRAFKDELDDATSQKDRRLLREIASATNMGRDIDVELDWLESIAPGVSAKQRRGIEWMTPRLRERQRQAGDAVDDALLRKLAEASTDLERRLKAAPKGARVSKKSASLAAAIADRLGSHSETLSVALAKVRVATDEAPAHEARIKAKRLRYLLEPAAKHVKGGTALLDAMKSLQDTLGELHDAHIVGHEVRGLLESKRRMPRAELGLVAGSAQIAAKLAFGQVRHDWAPRRAEKFDRDIVRVANRLRRLPKK